MMLVILVAPIGKKKMSNQIVQKTSEADAYFKLLQSQIGVTSKNKVAPSSRPTDVYSNRS